MTNLYQDKPLTKAQIAFNRKWIEALRSGNYKQAKAQLFDGKGYCCLGVACDIAGRKKTVRKDNFGAPQYGFTNGDAMETEALPKSIQKKLGFKSDVGAYDTTSLADDNDNGKKFKTIADTIENLLNNKIKSTL